MTIKRNYLKIISEVVIVSILYGGMGFILIFLYNDKQENAIMTTKDYLAFGFGCLSILMGIYSIINYIKKAPKIEFDKDMIFINSDSFFWKDLEKISLTGKIPDEFLIISIPKEGIMLQFKDGEVKYILDRMYSDIWLIKSFIQQVIINKSEYIEYSIQEIDRDELRNQQFESFKGSLFTSFFGIVFWALIAFIAYLMTNHPKGLKLLIIMGVLTILWFSFFLDYFEVSDKYLVVKSHILFWKKKIYRIEVIKEVAFETRVKRPNCMRIITKDFRTKVFSAGTLSDKNWHNLKKKLNSKGIKVRNELSS